MMNVYNYSFHSQKLRKEMEKSQLITEKLLFFRLAIDWQHKNSYIKLYKENHKHTNVLANKLGPNFSLIPCNVVAT